MGKWKICKNDFISFEFIRTESLKCTLIRDKVQDGDIQTTDHSPCLFSTFPLFSIQPS